MCLLVVTLMKIYNEKEQAEQGKLQNVNFRRKRVPWSGMKQNSVFKEINRLKKKSWNKEWWLQGKTPPSRVSNLWKETKEKTWVWFGTYLILSQVRQRLEISEVEPILASQQVSGWPNLGSEGQKAAEDVARIQALCNSYCSLFCAEICYVCTNPQTFFLNKLAYTA